MANLFASRFHVFGLTCRSSFVLLIGCRVTEKKAVTRATGLTTFLKNIDWKSENVQKKVTAAAFGAVGIGLCFLAWRSKRSVRGTGSDDSVAAGTEVRGFYAIFTCFAIYV